MCFAAGGRVHTGVVNETPEPEAAEVESARLLANESRERLHAAGLSDERIRKLADEFIVEHPNADPADFIPWALDRAA